LWWSGPPDLLADLDVVWRAYLRRFDAEHAFRFAKGTLGWTTARVRTPEQADRWTWLVLPPTPSFASPSRSPATFAVRGSGRRIRPGR
jgi:hypothetical protein